jgi:FkbM family methyltransferase
MRSNGELYLLKIFSLYHTTPVFFLDIGANKGEWTDALLDNFQEARGLCFEIIPYISDKLSMHYAENPAIKVYSLGLSSKSGYVDIQWNKTFDTTSAISPRLSHQLFSSAEFQPIKCRVEIGDGILNNIDFKKIDIMKVDVEGHEVDVLIRLNSTLRSVRRPHIIQFEYGSTYIPSKHNLQEIYDILSPCGYIIGRLFPDGVKFKDYEYTDDHFRMGNCVAIESNSVLIDKLQLI